MRTIDILLAITLILLLCACTDTFSPQVSSPLPPPTITRHSTSLGVSTTSTPTLLPTATPVIRTPINEIGISLSCEQEGEYTKCYDGLLKMSFEYSSSMWENIQPILEWGVNSGYEYKYLVDSSPDRLIAGGESRDHSEGREPWMFDFGSWDTADSLTKTCSWFYASACIEVKTNVIVAIASSDANRVCEEALISWGQWYPQGIVALQFRDHPIINGFFFVYPLFTEQDLSQSYSIIDLALDDLFPSKCDQASRQAYNIFFQRFLQGDLDSVSSSAKMDLLDLIHLAESIEFK